jgi:hypothetical protein
MPTAVSNPIDRAHRRDVPSTVGAVDGSQHRSERSQPALARGASQQPVSNAVAVAGEEERGAPSECTIPAC